MQYWLPQSFVACDSLPMADWPLIPECKAFVSMLTWKTSMRDVDRLLKRQPDGDGVAFAAGGTTLSGVAGAGFSSQPKTTTVHSTTQIERQRTTSV